MKTTQRPLFIPLKTAYYNAFKQRFKTHEIRLASVRWNRKTCFVGRAVTLSKGYGTQDRMRGEVSSVDIFPAYELPEDELRDFIDCYGEQHKESNVIYIGIDKLINVDD